jgi:hypothetical protein
MLEPETGENETKLDEGHFLARRLLYPRRQLDTEALLSDWRWLIGSKSISIVAVAAIGNLFLKGESGRIYLLEIEDGTCDRIAESVEELQQQLSDRHNRRSWLQGFLVRELRQKGILLAPGQCYGQQFPFLLCGEAGSAEDHEPIDLTVHVSTLGQLHRQARDLPPGSRIDEIRADPPLDP